RNHDNSVVADAEIGADTGEAVGELGQGRRTQLEPGRNAADRGSASGQRQTTRLVLIAGEPLVLDSLGAVELPPDGEQIGASVVAVQGAATGSEHAEGVAHRQGLAVLVSLGVVGARSALAHAGVPHHVVPPVETARRLALVDVLRSDGPEAVIETRWLGGDAVEERGQYLPGRLERVASGAGEQVTPRAGVGLRAGAEQE